MSRRSEKEKVATATMVIAKAAYASSVSTTEESKQVWPSCRRHKLTVLLQVAGQIPMRLGDGQKAKGWRGDHWPPGSEGSALVVIITTASVVTLGWQLSII